MDLAAARAENSVPGAVPSQYDSAHRMFVQYVDMSLYGGSYGGAGLQGCVWPNPPARAPAGNDEDDDGERMTEYLRKRVADIESGRVKSKTYTLDEYMRHLDKVLGG